MTWVGALCTSVVPVWKPALNCQNLVTWFPYIAIWWINSKVPEGSMITSENSSVARESSRVIILKSHLNSTGHSACTSKVHDIFDCQTHVPNNWWQLMCSCVLQPWNCRNSMMAPVRNITIALYPYSKELWNQRSEILNIIIGINGCLKIYFKFIFYNLIICEFLSCWLVYKLVQFPIKFPG